MTRFFSADRVNNLGFGVPDSGVAQTVRARSVVRKPLPKPMLGPKYSGGLECRLQGFSGLSVFCSPMRCHSRFDVPNSAHEEYTRRTDV